MYPRKHGARFLKLSSILVLSLLLLARAVADVDPNGNGNDDPIDDEAELIELLKIDEQEELEEAVEGKEKQHLQDQKDAYVLSKAQKIVLELNGDVANRVFDENEYVVVLGYAPWCAKSAEMMPQFAEAANKLKDLGSEILMTKIDAERYPEVAASIGIKGFPTLFFYSNKSHVAYKGEHSWQDIVIWARKKSGFPVLRIGSVEEAEVFVKEYPAFAMGFFEKYEGNAYEEFVKAAKSDAETQFVEVSSLSAAKILFPEITEGGRFIGLAKSEPEKYSIYYGDFDMENILQFIEFNKLPLVTKLTNSNSLKLYSSPIKIQVMVLADDDKFNALLHDLQEIARKFKSKVMIVYANSADESLAMPYLSLFGLQNRTDTVVIAFDNDNNSKYFLESDPTPSNIEEFCSQLSNGIRKPYYKSQELPDNSNEEVQIVVGKTFDEMVLGSKKHFLLEVYTPWCIQCDATSKKVKKLAAHFKDWEDVVIGRFDASENEHPKLKVDDYPTLLLYLAGDKEKPVTLPAGTGTRELAINIKYMMYAKDEL